METVQTATATTTSPTFAGQPPNPVLDQVKQRLGRSNYGEMRGIRCEFREGIAILEGRVCTFYAKQTAQELIRDIEGVVRIQNDLEVI